ncbi:MAG: hypothetical protein WD934_11565, partial [Gemmatimonadales bacterium]
MIGFDIRRTTIVVLFAAPLSAQQPSPYLPLDHWVMPWVEHLIATGAIEDPNPLTRPLRRDAVRQAVAAIDTVMAGPGVRRIVRTLLRALPEGTRDPGYGVEVSLGGTAGTDARREPLRPAGDGHVSPTGSIWLEGRFGPVVLVSHSYFERRLRFDPDYTGTISKENRIPGRFADAYASVEAHPVEVTAGRLSREWGPIGHRGLFVSSESYSYDHLFLRLGGHGARIEMLYTRLDDALSADSVVLRRYWAATRAVFRPWTGVTASIVQGVLWRGAGEAFNLAWVNPLQLAPFTREDEPLPDSANVMVGGQFEVRLPRGQTVAGELLIDDISTQPDRVAPARLGGTLSVGTPVAGSAHVTASYTFVSSLAYRTHQGPDFAILRNGIGLARNFDDYDLATLRVSALAPAVAGVVHGEVALLRQGEGDIRTPFTLSSDAPFLHIGVVARTLRLAVGADAHLGFGFQIAGSAGLHLVRNAAHVTG